MEYIYVYTCASMIMKIGKTSSNYIFKKCSCDITDDAKQNWSEIENIYAICAFWGSLNASN